MEYLIKGKEHLNSSNKFFNYSLLYETDVYFLYDFKRVYQFVNHKNNLKGR